MIVFTYTHTRMFHSLSIAKSVPQVHRNVSSREQVVNFIIVVHAHLPSSQFQHTGLERLSGQSYSAAFDISPLR